MKRPLQFTAGALALLLTCVFTWYAGVVVAARKHTSETLLPRLQKTRFPVTLADFSERQKNILLRVEDPGFYQHQGLDWRTPGAGPGTITQALAASLYFERFEPGLASLKQALIARFALDPLVSKDEQLLLYINTADFGWGARGLDDAAQTYYRKFFGQLTEGEYIALVATLAAPEVFSLRTHPQRNAERAARIRLLLSGAYQPRGVFDVYYGKLDADTRMGLPALTYFESTYE